MEYRVMWEIDVTADTPCEAAQRAQAIQLQVDSTATVFDVTDESGDTTRVDLLEAEEDNAGPAGAEVSA